MTNPSISLFTLARQFDTLDHKAMVEWVANNCPDVFRDAANAVATGGVPKWILEIPSVYRIGPTPGLVPLIKHIRTHTGMGLREAMLVARSLTGTISPDQEIDLFSSAAWAIEARGVLSTIRKAGILLA